MCRNVSKHNNRFFGGLAILCKEFLKKHVKILKNTNSEFQWVKLEKSFFGLDEDLFICVTYNPPQNSNYTRSITQDILELIEKDILQYKSLGNIMLCGDFNARVSNQNDYISCDSSQFLPLSGYHVDKELLMRRCCDTTLDTRGRELLELCISHQLRIKTVECLVI